MKLPESGHDRQSWLRGVVDEYERKLLAYATRLLAGDSERAQDVVQETLLRLCRAERASVADKIPAWLFSVCRTRVIDMKRTDHSSSDRAEAVAREPSPSQTAENQDTHNQIQRLVAELPARQQELLHLRLHAGLSYQQIADAMGMTVSNVGYQLHMAIRRLRESLLALESS